MRAEEATAVFPRAPLPAPALVEPDEAELALRAPPCDAADAREALLAETALLDPVFAEALLDAAVLAAALLAEAVLLAAVLLAAVLAATDLAVPAFAFEAFATAVPPATFEPAALATAFFEADALAAVAFALAPTDLALALDFVVVASFSAFFAALALAGFFAFFIDGIRSALLTLPGTGPGGEAAQTHGPPAQTSLYPPAGQSWISETADRKPAQCRSRSFVSSR